MITRNTFLCAPIACIILDFVQVESSVPFRFAVTAAVISMLAGVCGCSSAKEETKQTKQAGAPPATVSVISMNHPLAKYLELAGFRVDEQAAGKLVIKFVVINHSHADIGDLGLKVRLTTTAAKPEDPPVAEFETKVPNLGPEEVRDASGTATTKLRVYEIPDWQFLKAQAEITSPAP